MFLTTTLPPTMYLITIINIITYTPQEESGYGPSSSPPVSLLGASPAPMSSPGATSKSSQDEGDSRGSPSVKIPASPVSRPHAGTTTSRRVNGTFSLSLSYTPLFYTCLTNKQNVIQEPGKFLKAFQCYPSGSIRMCLLNKHAVFRRHGCCYDLRLFCTPNPTMSAS